MHRVILQPLRMFSDASKKRVAAHPPRIKIPTEKMQKLLQPCATIEEINEPRNSCATAKGNATAANRGAPKRPCGWIRPKIAPERAELNRKLQNPPQFRDPSRSWRKRTPRNIVSSTIGAITE